MAVFLSTIRTGSLTEPVIRNSRGSQRTPVATLTYDEAGADSIGHLTQVDAAGVSTTAYANFGALGRPRSSTQSTAGNAYAFSYSYNLAGSITPEIYPSGRTLSIGYHGAGRILSVAEKINNQNTAYISDIGYAPRELSKTISTIQAVQLACFVPMSTTAVCRPRERQI